MTITTTTSRRGVLGGLAMAPFASQLMAQTSAAPPATLIKNVQLFDGVATSRRAANVLVRGQFIAAVSSGDIPVDAGTTVIDGAGQTLMPGLTEAHWHLWSVAGARGESLADDGLAMALIYRDAEFQVMRGFTTVRDAGGSTFGIKAAIDRGMVVGPRCFPSGAPISQTSGHGDSTPPDQLPVAIGGQVPFMQLVGKSAVANGVPEVLAATRQQLKRGASQIKIMGGGGVMSASDPIDTLQYSVEETRAIVGAVSDWGTYVISHVYTPAGIKRAVECGVRCIEHGQSADDAACELMAKHDVWLSTQPFHMGDNDLSPEQWKKAEESIAPGGWSTSVRFAKKHGVRVAFGTDLIGRRRDSVTQNKMLPRLGEVYPNAEVLRMATSGNCELFELSGKRNPYREAPLGVIKEGAWADMLLIRGNPLDDLRILEDYEKNMLLIMKDGRIHKNIVGQ